MLGVGIRRARQRALLSSSAAAMLASEAQGLALAFDDSHFAGSGFCGSARVKDTGTPANAFDGVPYNLLTYTAPSPKLTRQSDGSWKYQAHNLPLRSESFATSPWSTYQTTPTGGELAYDGSLTAFKLTSTAVDDAHQLRQGPIALGSAGTPYRAALKVKSGTHRYIALTVQTSSAHWTTAVFDVGAASSTAFESYGGSNSGTIISTSKTALAGGYYLIELVGSTTSGTGGNIIISFGRASDNISTSQANLGDVVSNPGAATLYIDEFQFSKYPCATTYLATTGAARYGLPFEWNTSGVLQGILGPEPSATNLFLYSLVGATQTVTVDNAAAYTVSFFGTGSITFSGANSSTLNGTGATDRVSTTFTTGSTSLTCTVTGSITKVQVEPGSTATSPIVTYGSTVTRAVDTLGPALTAFPWNGGSGAYEVDGVSQSPTNNGTLLTLARRSGQIYLRTVKWVPA